jgi:sortase (surface protein transpeptidase)
MDITVGMGEWINSLMSRMMNATDGDCFYLPTLMHLHAYTIVKERFFPEKNFRVAVQNQNVTP